MNYTNSFIIGQGPAPADRRGVRQARFRSPADVGHLQGSAGLLRLRYARPRRRHHPLVRRQLGQRAPSAHPGRTQAFRRRRHVLPRRLRRRPAQLPLAEREPGPETLGTAEPDLPLGRRQALDSEHRRPEADGDSDRLRAEVRVRSGRHPAGQDRRIHGELGEGTVRRRVRRGASILARLILPMIVVMVW